MSTLKDRIHFFQGLNGPNVPSPASPSTSSQDYTPRKLHLVSKSTDAHVSLPRQDSIHKKIEQLERQSSIKSNSFVLNHSQSDRPVSSVKERLDKLHSSVASSLEKISIHKEKVDPLEFTKISDGPSSTRVKSLTNLLVTRVGSQDSLNAPSSPQINRKQESSPLKETILSTTTTTSPLKSQSSHTEDATWTTSLIYKEEAPVTSNDSLSSPQAISSLGDSFTEEEPGRASVKRPRIEHAIEKLSQVEAILVQQLDASPIVNSPIKSGPTLSVRDRIAMLNQPSMHQEPNRQVSPTSNTHKLISKWNEMPASSCKSLESKTVKSFSFPATNNRKCVSCDKNVYANEQVIINDKPYHKSCFKCSHCKSTLKLGNLASMNGQLYCSPHFKELFKLKGNYSEGFGHADHKKKWLEN